MNTDKLTIYSLQVKSFITQTQNIRGGAGQETSHGAEICGTDDVGCVVTIHDRPTHKETCNPDMA